MICGRSPTCIFAGVFAALLLSLGTASFAVAATRGPVFVDTNRSFLPHIMTGADLPGISGRAKTGIRVFADWGEGMQQVPYQIDERTAEGKYILDDGEATRRDEQPGVFDDDDEIVVLLRDAGYRVNTGNWPAGVSAGREVQLRDPGTGELGYVYVLSFDSPPQRSAVRHAQYDRVRDIATSAESRIGFHPKFPFVITDVGLADFTGGGVKVNLIDRVKVRIRGRTLGLGVEIEINEEDVKSHIVGTRSGPVRVIREIYGVSKIGPMPEVPLDIEMKLYPRLIQAPVSFRLPGPIRTFLSDIDVLMAIDARDMLGATFSTLAFNRGTLVDGKTTRAEQNVPLGDEEWLLVTGKGVTFYGQVALDRTLTLKKEVHFIDSVDGAQPPESQPGQLPEVGFKLVNWHSLEGKQYIFEVTIAALEGFPRNGGSGIFNSLQKSIVSKVGEGVAPKVAIAHSRGGAGGARSLQSAISAQGRGVGVELIELAGGKNDVAKLAATDASVVVLMADVDGAAAYLSARGIHSLRATSGAATSVPPDRMLVMMQQCLNPGAAVLFPTGQGRDRSLLPAFQKGAAATGLKLRHLLLDEKADIAGLLKSGAAESDAILIVPEMFWTENGYARLQTALAAIKSLPAPKPVFVTGRDGVAQGALLGLDASAGGDTGEMAGKVLALLTGDDSDRRTASAGASMQMYINPDTLRWGKFKLPIQIIKNATQVAPN